MASTVSVATDLYHWAKDDASRIQQIRAAFDTGISAGALTKGGMDSISSATKNGVTMQKMIGLGEGERITALRTALAYLCAGYAPSTRSRVTF